MMHNCTINDAIMLVKILDSVFLQHFGMAAGHRHQARSFFHSVQREKKPGCPLRPGFAQERIFFISAKEDNPAVLSSL